MPAISVERTIGETKRAVLGGLIRHNDQKMGKQRYRRFALSLRDQGAIVGGIVGEVWMTVLFGAVRSYLDTMSVQAPGFYRACGYEAFGAIDGYPGGVTRHWFTKAL
jgi:hypothetical protein